MQSLGWNLDGKSLQPLTIEAYLEDSLGAQEEVCFTTNSLTFNASVLWKDNRFVVEGEPYRVKTENEEKIVHAGTYSNKIYGESSEFGFDPGDSAINLISSEFKKLFDQVYYLGPTRVHPQRLYHWEKTHPKEIDLWGNEAVDALLSARVRQLTTSHNGEGISIEERISKWLQKLDLAHSFWLGPIGNLSDNNYEVRIQKNPNSAKVTLADMGHGVADLFPLLVHCCYVPEGSTLILEQPGVHLHPKAQADLADLFLEVIKERNLQILVESHSEHLLTRLQLHIAEQKIAASDTALYFCENENGVSTIKSLDVDELGNITNWPPNFFGNVRGDLVKMTREQMKRQKETEGE